MTSFVLGPVDRVTARRALAIAGACNRIRARHLRTFDDAPGLGTFHRQLADRLHGEASRFDDLAARINAQDC